MVAHDDGRIAPIDALALLQAEHAQQRLLFAQCLRLCSLDDLELRSAALVDDLCSALRIHATIEAELFYPALRAAGLDCAACDEADLAHDELQALIERLEVLYPGDAHFSATLAVLAEETAAHVAYEEGRLFALARRGALDLQGLAQQLAQRRAQLEFDAGAMPRTLATNHSAEAGTDQQQDQHPHPDQPPGHDAAPQRSGRRGPPRAPD
jgi:hypothetical protein